MLHTSSFDNLPDADMLDIMKLARLSTDCLTKAFHPEGFNVGINIGEAAGAGIEEHLHMHIVPRWAGDSNFMTSPARYGSYRSIYSIPTTNFTRFFPSLDSGF